jgi:hypothetical protein
MWSTHLANRDEASIDKIDRTFHETREAYRTIMRTRMKLLQKGKSGE